MYKYPLYSIIWFVWASTAKGQLSLRDQNWKEKLECFSLCFLCNKSNKLMFRSVSLFKVQTFTVYILNRGEFDGEDLTKEIKVSKI